MQTFGMRLEMLRTARGLRAKQLAERIDLDPSYIAQIERGRRDPPRQQVIDRMAVALDLTAEEAAQLSYAAGNERLLRAISTSDVQTPAMDMAVALIQHEDVFDEVGYLTIKTFIRAYVLSRAERTGLGKIRPVSCSDMTLNVEATM